MGWAIAVAVIGAAFSASEQRSARRTQQQAARRREQLERNKQTKERVTTLREERIKRARLLAALQARGAGGSSAQATGLGSLASQTGAEIGYQQSQAELGSQVSSLDQRAIEQRGRSDFYGSISSFALNYVNQ